MGRNGVGSRPRVLSVLTVLLPPGLGAGAEVWRWVGVGGRGGPVVRVEPLRQGEGGQVGRGGVHAPAVGVGVLGGGRVLVGCCTDKNIQSSVRGSEEGTCAWRNIVGRGS